MKKIIYFLSFIFVFLSCSVNKKPTFIKIDDLKLESYKADTIRFQAKAYFKNENDIGGKISTDEIKVFVDQVEVAQVSSEEFKVPANQEFSVPLKVVLPAKKVYENNKNGILGGLLNSVLNKGVKVRFKGNIKYKVLGFSSVYAVDKVEEIKL
ncbi:LEA type 2 family protein [Tenacibaculum sp. UWU-22]|uniref:LEA type 2 family protein n=1 Tax=Tenacibaculum sp. UWU-22 TaxID=3234187 RepID=UPI0034DB3C27